MTPRRTALLGLAALAFAGSAHAQAWPERPVKIVVPFSVGTAADIVARQLAPRLAEAWGQGVVVENVGGAGGVIGAGVVAKAAPDGYTLLMVGINHAINPSLYKSIPYDTVKDFRAIARVGLAPLAIVANPGFAADNVKELIALAKAKPGTINYGSGGNGSVTHLCWELLKTSAGIQMTHVPYKGIAQMMNDLVGNQIPLGAPAAASAVAHAKAGRLKVLAITSAKRSSVFPDVPTVAEAGIAGYDVSAWNGLLAPAGTPDAVVQKVYRDVAKAAAAPEFLAKLKTLALEVDVLDPAQFRMFFMGELDKWAKLVKSSGAKID